MLLKALLIGLFVFGERPDMMTLLGSLLVVLSGVYTLIHSRRIAVKLKEPVS